MTLAKKLREVKKVLEADGFLMLSDATLPSLVSVVCGAKVKGSWWSHPEGNLIFNVASALDDDPEVLTLKLVSGKVTFVASRLWPDVLAAVASAGPWQKAKLSPAERALLVQVEKAGRVEKPGASGKALEKRLLVHSHQMHTASGAHQIVLTSWRRLAKELGLAQPKASDGDAARRRLEAVLDGLNERHGAKAKLPWPRA